MLASKTQFKKALATYSNLKGLFHTALEELAQLQGHSLAGQAELHNSMMPLIEMQKALGRPRSMYSSSSAQTATHWTGTAPRALLSTPQQLTTRLAWLGPTCDEFGTYVHIISLVDSYHYNCRLSMRSQITSGEESIAAVDLLKDIAANIVTPTHTEDNLWCS